MRADAGPQTVAVSRIGQLDATRLCIVRRFVDNRKCAQRDAFTLLRQASDALHLLSSLVEAFTGVSDDSHCEMAYTFSLVETV